MHARDRLSICNSMVGMVNLEVQATHPEFLPIPLPLPPVIAQALHQQEIAFRITPGTVTMIAIVTTTGTETVTRVTTTAMIAGIAKVETAETAAAAAIDLHHRMIEIIIGHGIGTENENANGKRTGNEKEIAANGNGIWLGESEIAAFIETGIATRSLTEPAIVIGHRPDPMGTGRKVVDLRTVRSGSALPLHLPSRSCEQLRLRLQLQR